MSFPINLIIIDIFHSPTEFNTNLRKATKKNEMNYEMNYKKAVLRYVVPDFINHYWHFA